VTGTEVHDLTQQPQPASRYALDNDQPTAGSMLACLATMLDELSFGVLQAAGVRHGANCLELGAGGGSVAGWMARVTGDTGQVLALDLKPEHIPAIDGVQVLRCDVTRDALPTAPGQGWDVIHARLLLAHLPQRAEVLRRLADALAPGGALVIGSWGEHGRGRLLAPADQNLADLYIRYKIALGAVFTAQGNEPGWGLRAHQALLDVGLVDVHTIGGAVRSWPNGTAGCMLPVHVSTELQDLLVEHGMTAGELARLREAMVQERTVILSDLMLYTTGYRPGQGAA
jgi:SAM-dependent methyltransferase